MKPWMVAAIGGVLGGVATIGGLMFFVKRPELERKGDVLRRSLEGQLGYGLYAVQMNRLRAQLGTHAETVANRAADEHLANTYGLSRARMQSMEALARRLGVE